MSQAEKFRRLLARVSGVSLHYSSCRCTMCPARFRAKCGKQTWAVLGDQSGLADNLKIVEKIVRILVLMLVFASSAQANAASYEAYDGSNYLLLSPVGGVVLAPLIRELCKHVAFIIRYGQSIEHTALRSVISALYDQVRTRREKELAGDSRSLHVLPKPEAHG